MNRFSVLLATALAVVPASVVDAQVLPGISEAHIRAGRQQFSAEILRSVNGVMGDWKRAWERDRAGEAGALYMDEAIVVLPDGERIAGRENIRIAMEERILPGSGEVLTRQTDLAASGRMAISSGRYWFQIEEEGEIVDRSGTYMMVFMQDGRRWKIRSQLFSHDGAGIQSGI